MGVFMKKMVFVLLFFCAMSIHAQNIADYVADKLIPYEARYDSKAVAVAYAFFAVTITTMLNTYPDDRINSRTKPIIDGVLKKETMETMIQDFVELAEKYDIDTSLRLIGAFTNFDLRDLKAAYNYYRIR